MCEKDIKAKLIKVFGIVQGVGFRPFIKKLAGSYGIKGSVCNKGSYVEIFAAGDAGDISVFTNAIRSEAPPRAVIVDVKVKTVDDAYRLESLSDNKKFIIKESQHEDGKIFVSPDIAICDDCKRELYDKANPRYLHPFINCTQCGPRLTILDSMPYDRERTSMAEFPMCEFCYDEYTDINSRRYHAQPLCCNSCGPELYILDDYLSPEFESLAAGAHEVCGEAALLMTRAVIRNGGIAAIKGIGGFHLCCDASNQAAVSRLRELKRRPAKPFAVMMKNLEVAWRECHVLPEMEPLLDGPQKPIILMARKAESKLAEAVAPGNPNVGVMLPYTPVHLLIFDYPCDDPLPDMLVMTSGNPSGSPICINDEEASKYLKPICDIILSNNRKIRLRSDDSVMAFYKNAPYMIRRSRGYAPLPVVTPREGTGKILGIGGELKNTFCLADKDMYYQSPYIGDMTDMRSVRTLKSSVTRMEELLEIKPDLVVSDMHPTYNTGELAKIIANEKGVRLMQIQHHHAHMVSCMTENGYDGQALGIILDGTGYGEDGTIWGGEFLLGDKKSFKRVGSIMPFIHAGGDLASREGWRIAYSIFSTALGSEPAGRVSKLLGLGAEKERSSIDFMLGNKVNTAKSTSAGRLFDAASAVLGIKNASTFEGEASMALEFAAEKAEKSGIAIKPYEGRLINIDPNPENVEFRLCTDTLLMELAARMLAGEEQGQLAYFFHNALADMIVVASCYERTISEINTIVLSGGVFQNLLLLRLVDEGLTREGFKVLKHSLTPANDGGIALGQAAYGMTKLENTDSPVNHLLVGQAACETTELENTDEI